jgi:hypothetical protein
METNKQTNNCGLLSTQWVMSLDVIAPLCNDQQLIFKMRSYFLFPVIVARVKKVLEPDAMSRVYKVKIKKDFRVSFNQHGTLFT